MQSLSPLDGRYANAVDALRPFFSEDALIKARIFVEVSYLAALAEEKGIPELRPFGPREKKAIQKLVDSFDAAEAQKVRLIEKTTNHDVKAVEYYLRTQLKKIGGAKMRHEFIHFALTSEDVNNLAYGILITDAIRTVLLPELRAVIASLRRMASPHRSRPMLSFTHGQPATPSTLGKEIMVFVERLERQRDLLSGFCMGGKFGGAVGNYLAHRSAYPNVKWEDFGRRFVKSLKLRPLRFTTQINPHDDIAELSHIFIRINTILLDLSRDMWSYVSRGIFIQKVRAGEVGSSTMPHKVNPIDFENAEGNLGLSSALFDHFALKLPVSRLQRDLSDSTVQRNIGVAFGHHVLALASLQKGLGKMSVDRVRLKAELQAHPEVLTEAIQTVMRKNGIADAYERMKELSRGKRVTWEELRSFVEKLAIDAKDKERLLTMLLPS